MRKAVIVSLLCLLPMFGCRGQRTDEEKVPIRRATPPSSTEAEAPDSTASLGDAVSALLDKFQDANARYGAGEITKPERVEMAQEFEEEAWSLMQTARTLADKAGRSETDPKQKAYKQELELFLLLYLENLHAALCAERMALQTDKAQWNKRARAHAQLLPALANSIRWRSERSISLPNLSPGPGRLPSAPSPAKKATSHAEEPVTGD